jgi:hypothetical protein
LLSTEVDARDLAADFRRLGQAFLGGPHPDVSALVAELGELLGAEAELRLEPGAEPGRGVRELALPLWSGDRCLSYLVVRRRGARFEPGEQALVEAAAAWAARVLAMERFDSVSSLDQYRTVQRAVSSLSYSGRMAVEHLFRQMGGRSATVCLRGASAATGVHHNRLWEALGRLRAAGLIAISSRGPLGVRLEILNPLLSVALGVPDDAEAASRRPPRV